MKYLLQLATILFYAFQLSASEPAHTGVLPVGVVGSEPFVIEYGNSISGISVELWEKIARLDNINFRFVEFTNIREAIDATARGEVKALVGPISVTKERSEKVAFSQPYFQSGMGIAVNNEELGPWQRFYPFMKTGGLVLILSVLPCIFLVGLFVWLAERRRNAKHFPKHPLHGIVNGMWFALVTMTTVGYGDRTPITHLGRIIAGMWMLIAIILMSSLTAAVTASLTISSLPTTDITGPLELQRRKVAVVDGTTGEELAREYHARPIVVDDLSQAFDKLISHQADAVVFDKTILKYFLTTHKELDVHVIESEFEYQNYGIAFPYSDSKLAHQVNLTLLQIIEQDELKPIVQKWLERY